MALQLLIDGNRVNLSEGFSAEFIQKNPFFSKEGEHTMDIDINLHDPVNSVIYQNMHRIDINVNPSMRDAILMDGPNMLLHGTEIILEVTDDKAKIQIAAGNSELNYLFGIREYVANLDMGEIDIPWPESYPFDYIATKDFIVGTWSKSYPEQDFVCTPFCRSNNTKWADYDTIDNLTNYKPAEDGKGYQMANPVMVFPPAQDYSNSQLRPYSITRESSGGYNENYAPINVVACPYLVAVVVRLIKALGYEVGENAIADNPVFSKIIILPPDGIAYFQQAVPENWTISTFISEVEKLLNVIFDVDYSNRVVNIKNLYDFYNEENIVYIDHEDVIGKISKKFDSETETIPSNYVNSNVEYDFPDAVPYKYNKVDSEVVDVATTEKVGKAPKIWATSEYRSYADLWYYINGNSDSFMNSNSVPDKIKQAYGYGKIYKYAFTPEERLFMLRSVTEDNGDNPGIVSMRMINQFGSKTSIAEDAPTISMKIVPAFEVGSQVFWTGSNGNYKYFQYPIPCLPYKNDTTFQGKWGGTSTDATEKVNELNDHIQNGIDDDVNETDNIFISLHFGTHAIDWERSDMGTSNLIAPISSPSNECQILHDRNSPLSTLFWQDGKFLDFGKPNMTLEILGNYGLYKTYYSKNPPVDISKEFTIKFKSSRKLDSRSIFVIDNQKFFCKQLNRNLLNEGMSQIIEGTFYIVGNNLGGKSQYACKVTKKYASIPYGYDESVPANGEWSVYLKMHHPQIGFVFEVKVLMGDEDITATAWNPDNEKNSSGWVRISDVTGDIRVYA